MISNAQNIFRRLNLLRELTRSEIRRQTADSKIGWVWWLLDPIIMMCIYWGIIVGLFGRGERYAPYAVFILCALVSFKHFSDSVSQCNAVLRGKADLIKTIPFPTIVIPTSVVLTGFASFVFGIVIVLLACLIFGRPIGYSVIQLPVLMLLQLVVVLGVCMMVAALGSMFSDLSSITNHMSRVLFYLSPTLYGLDLVIEQVEKAADSFPSLQWMTWLYLLNPFVVLITGYRDALFYGTWLEPEYWIILITMSFAIFWAGYRTYQHFERRVIKFI